MTLQYVVSRVMRHIMPDSLARALLRRGLVIRPGMETRFPEQALERYLQALKENACSIEGRRILVFGYGGNFALGCGLLKAGAEHVVLMDLFAPPDEANNLKLLDEYGNYLVSTAQGVRPRPEYLTLIHADVIEVASQNSLMPVDLVLSTSVYEHLDRVEEITKALAHLTTSGGAQLHYIDLRDHYFKYPFEMLMYSGKTWKRWLNPTSNLNRWRLGDYQRVFAQSYQTVTVTILERQEELFLNAQDRIRAEFKTGDLQVDSVTLIRAFVRNPLLA